MSNLDHAQCLPWCGHLSDLRVQQAKQAERVADKLAELAFAERTLAEIDRKIQALKENGAR